MPNFFKNLLKRAVKSVLNDSSYSSLTGGGSDTPLSGNLTARQLLNLNKNWVFACVNKIATAMSGIELELRKYNSKGDDMEVYDHKILSVLAKPNNLMTGRDFMYIVTGHLQLTGNAYLLKDKEKDPTEIFPLTPAGIRVVYSEDRTRVEKYEYTVGSKTFSYLPELVVHIKKPSLTNPWKGDGIIEHIAEWVDVDSATTEFNRLYFKNGASVSGILKTNATTEKEMSIAKAGFEMRYEGVLNSHKTAVLGKGSEYQSLSGNPRDMQFTEQDKNSRDKILSAFGVPKSVLGIVDDVNRANAEASYYVFMMFTIDPEMKMFVAYLNEYLLPSFSSTDNLYFAYENIVPANGDYELRKNSTALAGQSYETINEVRAREGLPPIENGDFVYGGFATVPIGKPVQQQENSLENATEKDKKKKFVRESIKKVHKKDEIVKDIVSKVISGGLAKKIVEDVAEIAHKEFITRVTKYEGMFIKATKDFDAKLEEQVLKNLEEGEKSYDKKDLFNINQAQQLFVGLTSPVLQALIKSEGQAQMDRLDTGVPFNPNNESIQAKIQNLLKITAGSYTETTLNLLNAQLQEGVSNGESLAELTTRVSQVFGLTDQYRAERVARTTVFGTANNAAREAYKQSGVVKTVVWHTAEDEMVCEFCEPLNGKTVGVDEEFFEKGDVVRGRDGGRLPISFDNVEDPPVHANCRCFTNAGEIEVSRSVEVEEIKNVDSEEVFLKEMLAVLKDDE